MSEPPAPAPAPAPIQRRIISGNKSEIPALLGDPRPHLSRQDTIDAFRIPPIRIDPLSHNALSPISLPRLPVRVDLKQLDIARQQLKAISTLGGVPEDSNDQEAATTFTIEAPEKKGILWLQFGQSWEQRWCVLKEGNLYIFESQKAIIPLETLWLGGGVIKDRPDLEQNCFSVTTSDKQIRILHADEEYEYFTWIVTLRGATFYLRIAGAKAPALAVKAQPAIQMPRLSVHPAAVKSAPTTPAPHAQVEATKTQQQTSRPTSSEGPYLYFGRVKVSPTVDKRATKFFGTHRRHSSPEIQPIFAGKIKAGYLTVPEGKLFTSWKPRWVLLEGDSLYVFNSEADEPNKDEAIVTIKVLFCNAKVVKSTQSKYIFEVIMMAKNTTFGAATGPEMLEWISAIQEAQATLMGQYLQYDVLSTSAPTPSGCGGEEQVDDLTKSKQMLNTVLHIAGNDKCADCTAPDILWASINLGVFLCINCSGVHRSMGVHISKVRSVTMDKWESSTIQYMEETGNTRVNSDLEYLFPPGYTKLLPNAATGEREKYIRNKYEAKLFARPA